MPKYIKSHSNYVLKSFHQLTNDGTIYERDITTIGGVGNFPNGQTPIYRSNNFIITVRDDGGISNQYNRKKWTENKTSGDVWTIASVNDAMKDNDIQEDTKIVLKQDYYDFRDFCYYGSLAEMFRASVTDIINRFPGELYGTDNDVYYTTYEIIDGEQIETRRRLGYEIPSRDADGRITGYTEEELGIHLLSNPFGINMYSTKLPEDANPLKYFAEGGYKNYVYVDENGQEYQFNDEIKFYNFYSEYDSRNKKYVPYSAVTTINESGVTTAITSGTPMVTYYPCKGERVGAIDLNHSGDTKIIRYDIGVFLGDDDIPYYLYKKESEDTGLSELHIRPNKGYLDEFYNECDNFQKLILNPKTNPKYKAIFSVIKENDYGYYRDFEEFVFPTSEGGYNIDASSYGFNTYTTRLSQIGEFYDEFFTDNLYRSMTHEAIKNFDWTYTREYVEGDEEEYVLGGQKMQKALRVFAREFDEILAYINNIKNLNRVTYDERSNLPDYFLTDTVENEGWNVELVTPFDISGFTNQSSKLTGGCEVINLQFVEASGNVTPYSDSYLGDDKNGYFISCCSGGSGTCEYKYGDNKYRYKKSLANDGEFTRNDTCAAFPIIRNRIKPYSDEKIYTYRDVNNEFLRRLKLNSRAIWRHKGTIEGIDMILGMFGLKNKKWTESFEASCKNRDYDYEITEYIASSNTISDCWDEPHQMYHIDWVNSTKTITYDYRSLSSYDRDASDTNYLPYQGLPVKYVQNDDNTRTLYPNFEKYEQYDGNPYFQMRGGWEDKKFSYNNGEYSFQFDVDNNIVVASSSDALFKETVRNIRRFDTIQDMLSVPSYEVHNGQIVYVSKIEDNTAELAGIVYQIKQDRFGKYIELIKQNGVVRAGDDFYFDENITVFDRYGSASTVNITELPNGQVINCYIKNNKIQCHDDYHKCDDLFNVIDNSDSSLTNYFQIGEFWQTNRLKSNTASGGWERLSKGQASCKMLNTIINDNEGNNPHNGMMRYDNGKEYFECYKHLFKYSLENDMFDERCYDNYDAYTSTISGYGFSISDYYADSKIHLVGKNEISNQKMNTKVIRITFKLHNSLFGNGKGECEMKYIDDVVMNYLTQMIPSTAILQIRYVK